MNLTVAVLSSLFLVLIAGIAWVTVLIYSQRLSRIDDELREIKVMLSEIPKEVGLKEYMFAQDQQLRGIVEKLDTHPDSDVLQQYIHDQANQIIAIISTHDADRKSGVTKSDLEISLRVTNELLERILWSLRFDEDKYADRSEANKSISKSNAHSEIRKDVNDKVSMKEILESCDDDYDAMIEYMKQSDKSGIEAQHALNAVKIMRSSA